MTYPADFSDCPTGTFSGRCETTCFFSHKDHNCKCRFSQLRLSMFHAAPGKFPFLKGKAAEVRNIVPALQHVFGAMMDASNREHQQVKLGLDMAVRAEEILDEHATEYCLPLGAQQEFAKSLTSLIQLQSALGHHFHGKGAFLFHFTIKSHYALHIALISRYINPRLGWCYAGEDMMNKVQSLARASLRGTRAHNVSATLMRKYAFALGLGMQSNLL